MFYLALGYFVVDGIFDVRLQHVDQFSGWMAGSERKDGYDRLVNVATSADWRFGANYSLVGQCGRETFVDVQIKYRLKMLILQIGHDFDEPQQAFEHERIEFGRVLVQHQYIE